jgi:'Cold-shock' DNA-binding domain
VLRQKPEHCLIADASLEHLRLLDRTAANWSRCKGRARGGRLLVGLWVAFVCGGLATFGANTPSPL